MSIQTKNMNKHDFIVFMGQQCNITQVKAEVALNVVCDSLVRAIKEGYDVKIVGFGYFELRKRKGRKGINPKTQERIDIAPCSVVAFQAGSKLKEACNISKDKNV